MKIFKDRKAAGKILAERLKDAKAHLVLGIPRGGVVLASVIAKNLKLPLDIVVTRKIGSPMQPELALGAIDADGEVVWDEQLLDSLGMKLGDLGDLVEKEMRELKRREQLYRGDQGNLKIEGKTVILIDDGVATGATTLAAIKYLKRHKAKVILAVPVASKNAWEKISKETDNAIVLEIPDDFQAVGQFYQQFEPVSDEEVIQLLNHGR